MTLNWYVVFAYSLASAFLVSMALTALMRRLALKLRVMDDPGERKMHRNPTPLLGGVAIFATFFIVIILNFMLLEPVRRIGLPFLEENVFAFLGEREDILIKLIGLLAGGVMIFILGVVDDFKSLTPEVKLGGQIAAGLVLVCSGVHLELFLGNKWFIGDAATIVWIVLMTNSLNFLDNMDGLCGGVSVIAALSFFLCFLPSNDQFFLCVLLMVFVGSVAGFLYHNLSPARIFMGDAGSMFCGYILGTVAVLGTFFHQDTSSRIAIAAPLLALSVPLFDTLSVIWIRIASGESIMKGDKRHFSHRLVDAGMTPRQAVEFIFLVAAVAGLGAALLPQVSKGGTLILMGQTLGLFLLIMILMHTGKNRELNNLGKKKSREEEQ